MTTQASDKQNGKDRTIGQADRDLVALGIAVAALILFVGTGGSVMPKLVQSWMGRGEAPDLLLTNAVLLNIALLIFGWRRYNELHHEVAERRRAEALAQELADTDPLTGCFNRRSGAPAIDRVITEAMERQDDVAVLMLDIDNFKQINDLNGHKLGDRVLTEIAQRIRSRLPEAAVLARIGGDEFVCAIPFLVQDRSRIDHFAAELIELVSQPIVQDDCQVDATVSVGVASLPNGVGPGISVDSEKLIHRADIAMYHAKKRGRNRFYWFEAQMENELRFRNELENGIRRGVAAGEFVPYYEQQIDLQTGQLVGFEMLARWNSPQFGLMSPEVFIPIAEDIDMICELSDQLIRQALVDAKAWDPRLTLSVNISPLQLRDPWFAQRLMKMLADYGFPAERLEIEITESCLHENIAAVRTIVTSLKNQGIRISLDDFGTGYSSLSQLRALPFDRLKIDRSFVTELGDETSAELVQAIISLGHGLSLPVTAEGVESANILEALRGMGHLKGQGYLYGKPEDADATRQRLADLGMLAGPKPVEEKPADEDNGTRRRAG